MVPTSCAPTITRFWTCRSNLGIGGGVQCGYQYAVHNGYDVTVQMDGDGQHDPAYLMEVVQPVLDGTYDMCIGSRFIKKEGFQTSFMRRVGIRLFKLAYPPAVRQARAGCYQPVSAPATPG